MTAIHIQADPYLLPYGGEVDITHMFHCNTGVRFTTPESKPNASVFTTGIEEDGTFTLPIAQEKLRQALLTIFTFPAFEL